VGRTSLTNREEVTVGERELHTEQLPQNIIKEYETEGTCMMYTGDIYKILIGKPDGMIQLCGTRRTWDNNIRWILRK
jgi:hypothetical protein